MQSVLRFYSSLKLHFTSGQAADRTNPPFRFAVPSDPRDPRFTQGYAINFTALLDISAGDRSIIHEPIRSAAESLN